MSGGGESPASCTRARPRILRIPHLAHPASCASRISHTPTPPPTPTSGQPGFRHIGMFGSRSSGTRSTAPQRELHPPQRVAPAAARVAPAAARRRRAVALGATTGRKATRLHQGSPGLCCRLTRVHLARPAAPDVLLSLLSLPSLLSLLPTGRNDGTQGHLSHRFM